MSFSDLFVVRDEFVSRTRLARHVSAVHVILVLAGGTDVA
jgi:hypothetical protein